MTLVMKCGIVIRIVLLNVLIGFKFFVVCSFHHFPTTLTSKNFVEIVSAEIGSPSEIFRFLTFFSHSFFGAKNSFRRFSYIFPIYSHSNSPLSLFSRHRFIIKMPFIRRAQLEVHES